jgi:CheY-like chemotaxis protein
VLIANDGTKGLQLVWSEHPDICLLDLKMPGIHGDEILKEIKAKSPQTKCIMITASEGEGKTREKLLSLGAVACFDKPLTSLRDLEAKVKEALGK